MAKARRAEGLLRICPLGALLFVGAMTLFALATPFAGAETLGAISELEIPTGGSPAGIASGPDGNMWFLESGHGFGEPIARVTPAGKVSEFDIPHAGAGARSIAAGSDGNMWFTEEAGNAIGRITPTGAIVEFPLLGIDGPSGIARGPDGNMWFTEADGEAIGRITPSGEVAEFPLPIAAGKANSEGGPAQIAAGPEGDMWFTDYGEGLGERIGRITMTGEITQYTVPKVEVNGVLTAPAPYGIATGPEGEVWFTEYAASQIARINPATGQIATFAPSAGDAHPLNIALGPDGSMWFTQYGDQGSGATIGRITPTGEIGEWATPTPESGPDGIAPGPDGNMWFTESTKGQLAHIGTGAPAALNAAPSVSGDREATHAQSCIASSWASLNAQEPLANLFGFDGFYWSLEGKPIAPGPLFAATLAEVGDKLTCTQTVTYPPPLQLNAAAVSASVTVRLPRPVISDARLTSTRWSEGKKSYRHAKGSKPRVGTTLKFLLNVPVPLTFNFTQPVTGREEEGACEATTRENARHRHCTRYVTVARLFPKGQLNDNNVYFQGALRHGKSLKPGAYKLVITAANTTATAKPVSLSMIVLE